MKSERRHQLQTNNLSLALLDLPGTLKEHASTILLVVMLILLGISLYYYRSNSAVRSNSLAAEGMVNARQSVMELESLPVFSQDGYADRRRQLLAEADQGIQQVLSSSTDRHTLAQALLTKADLNWALGNSPVLPGAATRPALKLDQTPDEYLKTAQDLYTQVISQYPDEPNALASARFGLAAISENQHHWDGAAKQYDAVINDSAMTAAYHDLAAQRKSQLPDLEKPARLGPITTQPATPASAPTTKAVG